MTQPSVDLAEMLEFIARRYGLESFNSDEFINIIEDLTPYLRKEIRILRRIENSGVISALVAADLESESRRVQVINEVLCYLIEEEAFDKSIASEYIKILIQSFGWQIDSHLFIASRSDQLENSSQQADAFDKYLLGNSFSSYSTSPNLENSQENSNENFNSEIELGFSYIKPESDSTEIDKTENNNSSYSTFDPFKEAALTAAQNRRNTEPESRPNISEKKQKSGSKYESTIDPFKTYTESSLKDKHPVESEDNKYKENSNLIFELTPKQEESFIKLNKSGLNSFDSDGSSSFSNTLNALKDDKSDIDSNSLLEQFGKNEELNKTFEKKENLFTDSFNSNRISQITNQTAQNVFHNVSEESSNSDKNLTLSSINENSIKKEFDDPLLRTSDLENTFQMEDIINQLNNSSANIFEEDNSELSEKSFSSFDSFENSIPVENDLTSKKYLNQTENNLPKLFKNIDDEITVLTRKNTVRCQLKKDDLKKLAENLQTSYLAGYIDAQAWLFRMHRLGYGLPKSDQNAFEMVKLNMSEAPDPIAAFLLAECYLNGIGVKKDTYRAEELFSTWYDELLTLAYQGMGEACFLVAQGYEYGRGFEKNWFKALRWYRNGALKNSTGCRIRLGMAYLTGEGIKKNAIRGRILLEEANDPEAWTTLAQLYLKGELLPKDLNKANVYLNQAAKCGYLPAQNLLENKNEKSRE